MLNLASTLLLATVIGVQGGAGGCGQMSGAQSGSMPHTNGGFHKITRIMHSETLAGMLELTDDQIGDLEGLRYSHEEKVLSIKQEMEREQLALSHLMDDDELDRRAIETRIKNLASLKTDLQLEHIEVVFSIAEILTDEQMQMLRSGCTAGCHNPGSGAGQGMQQGMHHMGN